jgi:quinol monooxygenase YgiN
MFPTMASNSQGISLQITVHIAAENLSKFREAFKPVYDNVIMEPDCTYFEVFHSHEEPGTLSWIENWFALPIQVV